MTSAPSLSRCIEAAAAMVEADSNGLQQQQGFMSQQQVSVYCSSLAQATLEVTGMIPAMH